MFINFLRIIFFWFPHNSNKTKIFFLWFSLQIFPIGNNSRMNTRKFLFSNEIKSWKKKIFFTCFMYFHTRQILNEMYQAYYLFFFVIYLLWRAVVLLQSLSKVFKQKKEIWTRKLFVFEEIFHLLEKCDS